MTTHRRVVGEMLQLMRRSVSVDPFGTYREIGIRSFGKGIFHKEPLSGADLGNKRVFEVHPGDLVLSNVFAWEGAVALAREADRGRIGSHRFMTYVAKDDSVDLGYLRYFFISERGRALLNQASPGSAGRNKTLAIERFEALEIPVPASEEQQRIARQLDALVFRTASLTTAIETLVPDKLKAILPALVDNNIARLGPSYSSVGALASFISDTVHPGDDPGDATVFVGLQHIESHTGRRIGGLPLGAEKGRKFRFQPGDVVYGYLRPYLNKVWVADCHGLCSVDQYVLRPKDGISAQLLAFALRGRTCLDAAVALTHNLQLPRLRSGLLSSIEVRVVDAAQQASAIAQLEHLQALVLDLADRRKRQLVAIDSVLPSALNYALVSF